MAFVDPGDLAHNQVVTETWMDTARLDLLDLDTRVTTAKSTADTGVANAATADAKAGNAALYYNGSTTPGLRHKIQLRRTTPQTITTGGSDKAVIWQAADAQTGITWSSVTNPEQITVTRTGTYSVAMRMGPSVVNANGIRAMHIAVNGVNPSANFRGGDARPGHNNNKEIPWTFFSRQMTLTAGDVIRIMYYQDSGVSLDIEPTDLGGAFFSMLYEGPNV